MDIDKELSTTNKILTGHIRVWVDAYIYPRPALICDKHSEHFKTWKKSCGFIIIIIYGLNFWGKTSSAVIRTHFRSWKSLISSDQSTARTTLGALGKMFAEAAFTTVFLYTTELYPTVMRSGNTNQHI